MKIMTEKQSESILQNKISEIRRALNLELYNCALATALTLPDICGKVEFPNEYSRERYTKWFDKYVRDQFTAVATKLPEELEVKYQWLRADECYALRCAVLHSGDYKPEKVELSKIYLHAHKREWENYSHIIRDSKYIDAVVIDLCEKLCLAAEEYYNSVEDKNRFDLDEVRIDTW